MRGLLVFLAALLIGCSTDEEPQTIVVNPPVTPVEDADYFHLQVNESAMDLDLVNSYGWNRGSITRLADVYKINISCGFDNNTIEYCLINMTFDLNGKIISATQKSSNVVSGIYTYSNYEHFPSNYFNINVISVDETQKRIKLAFNGNLYLSNLYLEPTFTSEASSLSGELDMEYIDQLDLSYIIPEYEVPQYCTAKLNGVNWRAYHEHEDSHFTSTDAYKLETHFASSTPIGSYAFNDSSSDNYVKFSKFNTTTLTYDTYSVSGTVAYTYKENHGGPKYSFIGTFSFTAVNNANPAEIIQVTDGVFRSYQRF